MKDTDHLKLGLFAIFSIIILFLSLFLIGLRQFFVPKLYVVSIFDESTQGLDVGSPVKFRGVPVGKVQGISIRPYGQGIRVNMVLDLEMFDPVVEKPSEETKKVTLFSKEYFRRQVQKGLRTQIEMLSIMGTKYIEIDYFSDDDTLSASEKETMRTVDFDNYFFIPSKKSLLSDIKSSLSEIMISAQRALENFNKVDFVKLNKTVDEINATFIDVRAQIIEKGNSIDALLADAKKITERVNQWSDVVDINELKKTMNDIHRMATTANELVNDVKKEFKQAQLAETSAEARETFALAKTQLKEANLPQQIEKFNSSISGISSDAHSLSISVAEAQKDIKNLAESLSITAGYISEFALMLQENPSALIFGKGKTHSALDQ